MYYLRHVVQKRTLPNIELTGQNEGKRSRDRCIVGEQPNWTDRRKEYSNLGDSINTIN